jgi:hypothetical protein
VNVSCLREDRPNRPYPCLERPSHLSQSLPHPATMSRFVLSLEKSGSLSE